MKKYDKKRIGEVKQLKPLTKFEEWVYKLSQDLSPAQILSKRNNLTNNQRESLNLKKKTTTQAYLSKTFRIIEEKIQVNRFSITKKETEIQKLTKSKPFRVHAKGFTIKIKIQSDYYNNQKLLKNNCDIVNNNYIKLCKNRLEIISNKDIFGETPQEALDNSALYWMDFLNKLERKYKIILKDNNGCDIYEFRNHIAWINSPIEIKAFQSKGHVKIFDSNGRLRMIFDKSFNFKEWEAVDKEYFGQDMSKMHEVVRQNIEENVYLPLEVTDKINNLQSENQDLKQMLIQTTTNLNKVLVLTSNNSQTTNEQLQILTNNVNTMIELIKPKSNIITNEDYNYELNYFK